MMSMVIGMKKLLPYICALATGFVFGFLLFQDKNEFDIRTVFADSLKATAFQLGVFTTRDAAESLKSKHEGAIVMKDQDVYRVYYSILTNEKVIAKMEKYLSANKVNYYLRDITVKDSNLIKAINEYEKTMAEGSDTVLVSVNKLITSSYKGSEV